VRRAKAERTVDTVQAGGGNRGALYGLAAYALWGLFPLYWPLLEPAGPVEILAHRCLWSLVAVGAVLTVRRQWSWVRPLLADRRRLRLLVLAAVAISGNWGMYIYGVNSHQVVQTSLGYFINPLVTVLLGVVVLHERLTRAQTVAVAFGAIAVLVLTASYGHPPWIALFLAGSFGSYGLLKKKADTGALESLTTETGVLALPAVGYLIWLGASGTGTATRSAGHAALLVGSGVVTAIPLLLFGAAATRLPLTTIGLLQYLTPIMQLLLGVLVRHEPLPPTRMVGIGLLWIGLAVYSWSSLTQYRRGRLEPAPVLTAAADGG